MSQANNHPDEEILTRLMVEYDEALAADAVTRVVDESVVDRDAKLALEWDHAKECIELLDRARRLAADRSSTGLDPASLAQNPDEHYRDIQAPRRLGRFHIKGELGRGGLGIVYLAHDPELRRDVALKVPRLESLLDDAMSRRFLREAEAAARLSHPNLVTLLEVGQDGLICYLASEYCSGPTLAAWLRSHRQPVPANDAAQLVLDLAAAVEHAHGRGVLHRDIKPSNVLLQPGASSSEPAVALRDLSPKLTDFGLAKLLEHTDGDTCCGTIVGTVAYMSPEQAEGRIEELDARTDVYMLGAVLYELLTGSPPFVGKSDMETLRQLIANEPTAPRRLRRDLPRDLEAIALKCLAKRQSRRYATAHDLFIDLQRFLAGQPTVARPVGLSERTWKWSRRRPAVAASLVLISIAALSLMGISTVYSARLAASLDETRQLLYATDMQAGFDAWQHGSLFTAHDRLDRHLPDDNEQDLRTFPWRLLDQFCHANQRELFRHASKVTAVDFSPDGKWIASAEGSGPIHLWDVAASKTSAHLRGHTDDVNDLSFSPDSRFLASAGDDRAVRIWELGTQHPPQVLTDLSNLAAYGVAFAPDGALLAVACEDGQVRLWNTRTWKLAKRLSVHSGPVMQLAFSPDGLRLATCSNDGTALIISVSTGEILACCDSRKNGEESLSYLAFSHDGAMLATGRHSGKTIGIWCAKTGDLIDSVGPIDGFLRCLTFSPDDQLLVAGFRDGGIQTIDTTTFENANRLLSHTTAVRDLAFSPDGLALLSVGTDGTVKAWDMPRIERCTPYCRTAHPVTAIAIPPTGSLFAFADDTGAVTLINTRSGNPHLRIVNSVDASSRESKSSAGLTFSADGQLVAYSARNRREIHLFDINRQAVLQSLTLSDARFTAIAFAADDRELFTVDDQSQLTRWDLHTSTPRARCKLNQPNVFAVQALPIGNCVMTAAEGGIHLRDSLTLAQVGLLPSYPRPLRSVAVSPDESLLTAGTTTGEVLVWDLTSHEFKGALAGHTAPVDSVAFSPDGTTIVSCSSEGPLRLWDVRAMQEAGTIPARDHFTSVRFSPDGNTLAAGGGRARWGTLQFWSAPRDHNGEFRALASHPAEEIVEYRCLLDGRCVRQIDAARNVTLDSHARRGSSMMITGGSHAQFNSALLAGEHEQGRLTVCGQSTLCVANEITIGRFAGAEGAIKVADNSTCISQGNILIGKDGSGDLLLTGGSMLRAPEGLIGTHERGEGAVVVEGHDSSWELTEILWVGDQGRGRLRLADSARVTAEKLLYIGATKSASGSVVATGMGTVLATNSLVAGDRGEGLLELSMGAVANVQIVEIAQKRGSGGTITVEGSGTTLACNGACYVGGNVRDAGGQGTLTVTRNGVIRVADALIVYDGAIINVDGGELIAASVDMSTKGVIHYQSGTIDIQGLAKLDGVIRIDGPQVENAVDGMRITVMKYGSLQGRFSIVEGPPGIKLEPVYTENGLDVIVRRAI